MKEAIRLFQLIASRGHPGGQRKLGACYHKGEGVPKDLAEAVRLYRLAADQDDATAQSNLGLCFQRGIAVQQDLCEAVRRYNLSALHGSSIGQQRLGVCYEGLGGLQRPERGRKAVSSLCQPRERPWAELSWNVLPIWQGNLTKT